MNDTLTITHRFIVNPVYRRYNGADVVVGIAARTLEQRVSDRTDFLKHLPLFVSVSDAELSALAKDFTARRFQQGEAIFFQGDPGQALYLIESGRVRIYVQDDNGQETSVIFYSAGDIFGELAHSTACPAQPAPSPPMRRWSTSSRAIGSVRICRLRRSWPTISCKRWWCACATRRCRWAV